MFFYAVLCFFMLLSYIVQGLVTDRFQTKPQFCFLEAVKKQAFLLNLVPYLFLVCSRISFLTLIIFRFKICFSFGSRIFFMDPDLETA